MWEFTKEDMFYQLLYNWQRDGDNGPYTGNIDPVLLNRSEGYEVLDFANNFLYNNVFISGVSDLHKLEKLLRNKVPQEEVMKDAITKILLEKW